MSQCLIMEERAGFDKEDISSDAVWLPLKEPLERNGVEEDDSELTGKSVLKEKKAEGGGKILWRVANGLMTLFFVMAVGVQFNDPDPYLWVPLYGIAALLTVCVTVQPNFTGQKWWRYIYWIHTVFCLGMFCYVFVLLVAVALNPKSEGALNPLMHEEGREMAGIMITVIWLFTCKQSPTIRCIFPRWCSYCHCPRVPEQLDDVLVDMTRSSLLVPPERI